MLARISRSGRAVRSILLRPDTVGVEAEAMKVQRRAALGALCARIHEEDRDEV